MSDVIGLRASHSGQQLNAAIGRAVAQTREEKGMTHATLAARLGRSRTFVEAVEAGTAHVSPSMVVQIARALDVSSGRLLQLADRTRL